MTFRNPAPLGASSTDLRELALDGFPIVDDFALTLSDTHDGGTHVDMVSALLGRLAGFPAWDHADRDLRHFTLEDVPLGSIDEPYDDRDDAWRLLIFEHEAFVYVLEGRTPAATEFEVWFRVPAARYTQAWEALIDTFNPAVGL